MRLGHRLVEMEVVDDVPVRDRLQLREVVDAAPSVRGDDDRVARGACSHGGDEAVLDPGPALERHLARGFVHRLQEDPLGVARREVGRHRAPEGRGLERQGVVGPKAVLRVLARVPVDDHGESGGEDVVQRRIKIWEEFGPQGLRVGFVEEHLHLDRETHMGEAGVGDERKVPGAVVGGEPLVGVGALVSRDLREPVGEVDPLRKGSEPGGGNFGPGRDGAGEEDGERPGKGRGRSKGDSGVHGRQGYPAKIAHSRTFAIARMRSGC